MRMKPEKTTEEQLTALAALPDDQIDLSDAPELSDEQWANSVASSGIQRAMDEATNLE